MHSSLLIISSFTWGTIMKISIFPCFLPICLPFDFPSYLAWLLTFSFAMNFSIILNMFLSLWYINLTYTLENLIIFYDKSKILTYKVETYIRNSFRRFRLIDNISSLKLGQLKNISSCKTISSLAKIAL